MKPAKIMLIFFAILILSTNLCFAAAPNPSGGFIYADIDDETGMNEPAASLRDLFLNGSGGGTFSDLFNSEGEKELNVPFTYSIAADGSWTLQEDGESIVDHGIFSADGNLFTLVYTEDTTPGIAFGIKKSSGLGDARANAWYRMSSYGDEAGTNDPWSEFARISLDGNGNGYYYSDSHPEDNGPFTYYIDPADGQLTITAGEDVFHGIVSADGSIFTLAETILGEPAINVGIKESTGLGNARANGCYVMSGFGDEIPNNAPWSGLDRICLDGNGIGTYYAIESSEPDDENESGPFTYSIDPADGQLTLTVYDDPLDEPWVLNGIVSADGSIFTLTETGTDEPEIDVAIKKSTPVTPFSISGGVMNVHRPDDNMYTYIFIDIGGDFSGTLPDDISIAVTGPSGLLPYEKSYYVYYPQFREFLLAIPGSPAYGPYTFTVWGDSSAGTATDTQSVNKEIPIPDVNSFSPADGATVGSKTPTFSWGEVTLQGTILYYRLEIKDDQDNRVYATNRTEDMLSHKVPAGVLTANQTYRWRVRVTDSSTLDGVQNRSQSSWATFTIRVGNAGIPLLLLSPENG